MSVAGRRRRLFADLFRRIWRFLVLFVGVYFGSALFFYLLEPSHNALNSLYWAGATVSTVGYGDVTPTQNVTKILTTLLLVGQVFLGGYLVSVITSAVVEERQQEGLGMLGTDLKDHIVVLGYTGVGRSAVRELLVEEQRVAVVTERAEDVANVRSLGPPGRVFATYGPIAETDILKRVNVGAAHSVIVCSSDDATNMIAALNVKTLAPSARIVVSVTRAELREPLQTAGVTYISSPADMGGRLCAAAAFEPEVAIALEDITAADVHSDLQEYILTNRCPIRATTFAEAERQVREASGTILIGYAHRGNDGEYRTEVNPPPATPLAVGDALIILGRIESLKKFRSWFGAPPGR